MEKYGVQIDEEKTKTGGNCEVETCPKCGLELEKSGGTYIKKCPTHGTEPFEARR